MKKYLILALLLISATTFGQTGVGWLPINYNANFKGNTYFTKGGTFAPTSTIVLPTTITLPSGTVMNFDGGDVKITHSANTLTISDGVFAFPSPFTLGGTSITSSGDDINILSGASPTVTSTDIGNLSGTDGNLQDQIYDTIPALGAVVLVKDTSIVAAAYHYPSSKMFADGMALKIPYTGATTDVNLGANSLTLTKNIDAQAAIAGGIVIYGYNTSTTDYSYGIKGKSTATGGSGHYYGVHGEAISTNTGANYGVYGYAANATTNYAGYFQGDLKIEGRVIFAGIDTCLGSQTKSIVNKSVLRVTGTCTLKGLTGGKAGQILYIINTSATTLVLKHNTGSEKFFISGAGDLTLAAQGNSVTCLYDGYFWYILGKGQ